MEMGKTMMFDYAKSSKLYDTLYEYYGVLKLCRPTRKSRVLDVGCGLNPLKHVFKDSVVGVDLALNSKADIIADAYHLPFRDKSFDYVVSVEVIEHLKEPDKFIEELKRVSRRYIVVSTANSLSGKHDERHVKEYNLFSLKRLFKKHGLTVISYDFGGAGYKKFGLLVRKIKILKYLLPQWVYCEWFAICGEV